jgi:hypothetical protein
MILAGEEVVRLSNYEVVCLLWSNIWLLYYFCVNFAGFYCFLGSLIVGHLQIQAKCGCVHGSIFFVHMYTNMWLAWRQHFSRQITYKFLKWTILRPYLQNGIVNVNYATNFLMVSGSGKLWLISSVYPKWGLQCIMGLWCMHTVMWQQQFKDQAPTV